MYRIYAKQCVGLFLTGLLTGLLVGCPKAIEPLTPWVYGGNDGEYGLDGQQTPDGGYILVAHAPSGINLVKADENGNIMWSKTFGEFGYGATAVRLVPDGGCVVAGSAGMPTWHPCALMHLLKTDESGNVEWSKTFPDVAGDVAADVQPTADGGYIVLGRNDCITAEVLNVYLVKTDANGDPLWSKTYTFGQGDMYDAAQSVLETSDGEYVVAGYTYRLDWCYELRTNGLIGHSYSWLLKTNHDGDLLWRKTFGLSNWDQTCGAVRTSDNGYVMAGYFSLFPLRPEFTLIPGLLGAMYLRKTDADGNTVWVREFNIGLVMFLEGMCQTADGGYVLVGDARGKKILLIKTSESGHVLWSRSVGNGGDLISAAAVQQTSSGDSVIVGSIESEGTSSDMYVFRIDPEGNPL